MFSRKQVIPYLLREIVKIWSNWSMDRLRETALKKKNYIDKKKKQNCTVWLSKRGKEDWTSFRKYALLPSSTASYLQGGGASRYPSHEWDSFLGQLKINFIELNLNYTSMAKTGRSLPAGYRILRGTKAKFQERVIYEIMVPKMLMSCVRFATGTSEYVHGHGWVFKTKVGPLTSAADINT
jgi:hypothetical protein